MLKKAALAGASLLCLAQPAHAQNFSQLIAFGDSTTDTGWFANASTGTPGSFGAFFADLLIKNALANGGNAHFTGPGPGNAQILGGFFGLPANPANTAGGTNYAIGGAFNGATLGPGFQNLFSTDFMVPNPKLPSTATQISSYLASVNGDANPNGLYLISSGGNNIFYAAQAFGPNASAANAFLLPEAQALANGVAQLQQAGARYIIVSNEYQPPSVTADPNAVRYGQTLTANTFTDLAAKGTKFIFADTSAVIAAVEQSPLAFGITAPISSNACNFPGNSARVGTGVVCANTTTPSPNGGYGNLVSADATRTHLFVDGTHLTEAGQIIIADFYHSLLIQPWDGTTTVGDGPVNNANLTANGGNGIWNNTSTNWATSIGTINSSWHGISAVFGGSPGTVTVAEPIAYQSIEFSTGGYILTASAGGTLMPTGVAPIIVDGGLTATIATPISGSGGMDKTSLGTLILTGADTYTGGTQLNGGTLVIGNNSALGSGTLAMAAGTTLSFLDTGNFTVGNNIIITGDPSFTPPAGTTQTLAGVIADGSSPGTLNMNGVGTLVLTNNNTYTGSTEVTSGTLDVAGSIASSNLTTVASSAALTGTGSVGNLQVDGTFAPGTVGAPGTSMSISGNLAFASGALYVVYFNPATSTLANVTGTASLAGTVNANFANGSYISKVYTIVSAGSVTGTFGGLTTNNLPANFTASLAYDSAHAFLDLTLNFAPAAPSFTPLNVNQSNVADALINHFNTTGSIPMQFGALTPAGLTAVDGEAATGAERGAFDLMNEFLGLMLDPFVYGRGGGNGAPALGFAPDQETSLPPDMALAYASVLKAPQQQQTFYRGWTAWGAGFGGGGLGKGERTGEVDRALAGNAVGTG